MEKIDNMIRDYYAGTISQGEMDDLCRMFLDNEDVRLSHPAESRVLVPLALARMAHRRQKKRTQAWSIAASIAVMLLLGGGIIYQQYANRDDLECVACLTNRRLDDGTRVDITLLRACDSVGMQALMRELNMPQVVERRTGSVILTLRNNTDLAVSAPRRSNGKVNLRRSCLVGLSISENTIFIYHNVRTERRYRSILAYVLAHVQGVK